MSAHTNLSDWIARRAVMHPDKTALVTPGERYSYRRLADVIAKVSGALRDGLCVEPGDRVAYLGQNSALAVALFFACARVGAIFLPLNWRLARREHLYILADARPKALIAEAQFFAGIDAVRSELPPMALLGADKPGEGWPAIADLIEATPALLEGPGRPELPFLLCYTSGTTGRPKGAVLTQEAVLYNAINSAHMHDMTGADRILSTLPMFHVGGLNIQTSPAFHAGAEVFLHPAFDPEATIDALERERITLAVFVPAQITALLAHPRWQEADLSHLRAIATGSTIVPTTLIEKVHARGIPVIQIYGATETAPIAVYQVIENAFSTVGSTGRTALHCEVKVVDEVGAPRPAGVAGEILVRGPNVFTGYWNDEAATRAALIDGWFHTGDVGHFDEAGNLYVDDRIKDMIISGGENIYPAALERILDECPQIAEAVVVGQPDARWGEVPVAVVVMQPEAELSEAEVIALFEDRVARFQYPKAVLFRDSLPRNAMGKVVKASLRDLVRREIAALQRPYSS